MGVPGMDSAVRQASVMLSLDMLEPSPPGANTSLLVGQASSPLTTAKPTRRPIAGSNLDRSYGRLLIALGIVGLILIAIALAIAGQVLGTIVFVFPPTFTHSDVPYYIEPIDDASFRDASRYGVNYVLTQLVALKVVTPFVAFCAVAHASRGGAVGGIVAAQVWTILHAVYEVGVSIYFLVFWFAPTKCQAMNICRAWTAQPLDAAEIAGQPNYTYSMLAWSGVAWGVVVTIIYYVLLEMVRRSVVKRQAMVDRGQPDPVFDGVPPP